MYMFNGMQSQDTIRLVSPSPYMISIIWEAGLSAIQTNEDIDQLVHHQYDRRCLPSSAEGLKSIKGSNKQPRLISDYTDVQAILSFVGLTL